VLGIAETLTVDDELAVLGRRQGHLCTTDALELTATYQRVAFDVVNTDLQAWQVCAVLRLFFALNTRLVCMTLSD